MRTGKKTHSGPNLCNKKSTGGTGSSNMLFTLRKPDSVRILF